VWCQLRGFDTTLSPALCEDLDYCARARALGHTVYYQPESVGVLCRPGGVVEARSRWSGPQCQVGGCKLLPRTENPGNGSEEAKLS